MKARRAAIYCRESTKDQSPAAQLHDLRSVAELRGWPVVVEYHEQASGASELPELRRCIHDGERGRWDVALIWGIDRIGRGSTRSILFAWERLEGEGGRPRGVYCHRPVPVDTGTPAGRLMRDQLAAFAAYERELIAERTRAGLRARKASGVVLGRPPMRTRLAKAVRARRKKGMTLRKIAAELKCSPATVYRALKE